MAKERVVVAVEEGEGATTNCHMCILLSYNKGIDGSARKPARVQDTEYMFEKT